MSKGKSDSVKKEKNLAHPTSRANASGKKEPCGRKAENPEKGAGKAAGSRAAKASESGQPHKSAGKGPTAGPGGSKKPSTGLLQETGKRKSGKKRGGRVFLIPDKALIPLNVAMALLIGVLVAVSVSQHSAYGEFVRMRDAVDRQTFYEGTTVEGVDVSHMTLSNALEYWKDRVEPRYAGRQVTLDNGMTVTSAQLGYASDYETVLSAAWSAGRNGSLEERYRMVAYRRQNPAAYSITRVDFEEERVESFAQLVALEVDRPAVDAAVRDFDAQTYAFTFTPSEPGKAVDIEALAADVKSAIRSGGGSVALKVETLEPQVTTEEAQSRYGLIDYAITNASSSSKARLNNIKLAMSFINGMRLAPGETFSFNGAVGERTYARGFRKAAAYSAGEVTEEVGGGICQVSTTLFNAAVKADMEIVERHNHSLTVSYVDKGKDATVDWGHQDLRFTNTSEDDIFICCYLTEDKRVRFGLFGRLLPDGEKITLEAETTEVIKYETEYIPSPSLPAGATYVSEKGRNGYKAEAYKIRWDAQGNRISSELLCKSVYKAKNEVVQYGA